MSFVNQFSTYFTPEQRETELYNLWATIGANMEKAILEEQSKLNTELTDINNFSEDTLRSWLAFFLMKIPYRTSATVQVTTSLNGSYGETEIPKYAELSTDDGIIYTQMEKLTLSEGDVRTVTAVQGIRVVEQGTYSTIIKIQATNPDLTYLTVKIGDTEIPEVSYETSYDQLLFRGSWKPQTMEGHEWGGTPFLQNEYATKGEFYTVIADGETKFGADSPKREFRIGDLVVFDGQQWQREAENNNLSPIQFANSYAVPRNGYFAYYFGGYLYIKVFSGSEISDPEGQQYEISYIQSDGVQGEIKENTLSYISNYEDADENPVILNVSNKASTAAVNEPSRGKLGIYLKQRFYTSINVASIPEYTMWFKAQPEVGDCLVLSDYERYVQSSDIEEERVLSITGIVDVYLVGPDGNPLSSEVQNILLERLEPYKDIAVVRISEFQRVKQYLIFEYTTTNSTESFEQFVKSKAGQYYNLSYLQSTNSSLFSDLDLAAIIKDIQVNSPYSSTGLILKGYHYKEYTLTKKRDTIVSYDGERPGTGWYYLSVTEEDPPLYTYEDELGNTVEVREVYLEEIEDSGNVNSCNIYQQSEGEEPLVTTSSVGQHLGTSVILQLDVFNYTIATLKCYWGMQNEGMLAVGVQNGLRELQGIEIKKV